MFEMVLTVDAPIMPIPGGPTKTDHTPTAEKET